MLVSVGDRGAMVNFLPVDLQNNNRVVRPSFDGAFIEIVLR
jgi:hypothetical protein